MSVVNDKTIKELNKKYRGKDAATDVLAFTWKEDKIVKTNFLGQIFISYPKIIKQAKEYKATEEEEFTRMLAHGALHLAGYDHQTKRDANKMFKIQEEIIRLLCSQ